MSDNEIKLDHERDRRIGLDEAIFCSRKSDEQIEIILGQVLEQGRSCLLTHLDPGQYGRIDSSYRDRIDFDEITKTAFFNWKEHSVGDVRVGVVTAGSSDVPVAKEAMRTLQYFGIATLPIFDVGVAGIWRLLDRVEEIRDLPVVIAAAGMDAALPSVLGGLYPGLLIAIPTSVGYGVAEGGRTALNSILASCASGVVTVNIDNGYGAACAAIRALGLRRDRLESSNEVAATIKQ